MIVYSESKTQFRSDVLSNKIERVVLDLFKTKLKRSVGQSEVRSWKNSMQYMDRVLEDAEIPEDSKVSIEYSLPQSSKRIDFILSGKGTDRQEAAVIVELKQWEHAKATDKDAIVRTHFGGHEVETEHPSYQAWTYAALLEDYNETVQKDGIRLVPCAYLHNCAPTGQLNSSFYAEHCGKAPLFFRDDAVALRNFIKQYVKYGDTGDIMYRIDHGRIRPSKNLADTLLSMIRGNREFLMIDDQKLVFETALWLAGEAQAGGKHVLIVEGGPGTGKSVVAINLLVEMTKRELVAQYVSRNAAPRTVYASKLKGSFKRSHIDNLFKGSGAFLATEPDAFDALIVDEAHRLNEKSGLYGNQGENQIKEIISSSRLSVFFLDEDQRVTLKDIGEKSEIRRRAEECGATVTELELQSQFRCNGSDGYLAWLDHALQTRETAHSDLSGLDYEFVVCDSPSQLRDMIFDKNSIRNKARLVAGYCWPWASKKDPDAMDIVFPGTDFAMQWNLTSDGSLWIVKPESVNEVGCIHTCQGLELDYVGVIIGDDFTVRDGQVVADAAKRARQDRSVLGFKKLLREDPERAKVLADLVVKNTYKTLMTRGQKGCYIYCTDRDTNEYFKSFIEPFSAESDAVQSPPAGYTGLALALVAPARLAPYRNAVPVFADPDLVDGYVEDPRPDTCDWVALPEPFEPRPGYFVARVGGESLSRRIPEESWCLFRSEPTKSKARRVLLVRREGAPGLASAYLIESEDDIGPHATHGESDQSLAMTYGHAVAEPAGGYGLKVLGELVAILE